MEKYMTTDMLNFIENSPTCFQAIDNIKVELENSGFKQLLEGKEWKIEEHGKYYIVRNGSSIIAFKFPGKKFEGFNITASHSDSPTFKIKSNPEICVEDKYIKINVEKYGGMIMSTWFDRPLSIAGRAIVRKGNKLKTQLVNIDRDLLTIPSLAIHMSREINEGYKYNAQKDMLPLFTQGCKEGRYMAIIEEYLKVKRENILGLDLFLYNRDKGKIWGADNEFISSPRIDNLECAYTTMAGFINQEDISNVSVYCVFDNEEVGSTTKQGAASTFLKDILKRIVLSIGCEKQEYYQKIASSFMISADNAHACHPNYMEKSDPVNKPCMNKGVVIKANANQKYTTDAVSMAIFKQICEKSGVPTQEFVNRSDIAGGSTLGNISNEQVSMNTVDIGAAQLAMHSAYETAGIKDSEYLIKAVEEFYKTDIKENACGSWSI